VGAVNTTGSANTSFGYLANAYNTTGSNNSAFGREALGSNVTQNNNSAFGVYSLSFLDNGTNNAAFGILGLQYLRTGSNNTALGASAGRFISGGVTSASYIDNSIFIGQNTKALADAQTNQIVIGYNETGLGSNTTILGNSSTVTTAVRGNLLLGTTTESGLYKLDVNGTARVQGTTTITGSTTAASAIARGANITSTLVAAANSDVLVGLDINPTFTNGAFTGVTNLALRVNGATSTFQNSGQLTLNLQSTSTTTSGLNILSGTSAVSVYVRGSGQNGNMGLPNNSAELNVFQKSAFGIILNGGSYFAIGQSSGEQLRLVSSTGNLLIASTTDNGTDKLQVTGSAVIGTATTVAASAQLQVTSTTKGFLPPRMTTTQRDAISSPATGLQVYNTTTNTNDFYNGSAWTSQSVTTTASGTYTPTSQDYTNITSATNYTAQYMRVGNVVTVSGKISTTSTASATLSYFSLSLPITSSFTTEQQAAGNGTLKSLQTSDKDAVIYAGTGSNKVQFSYYTAVAGASDIFYHFTYLIN
jgi:hypothetical protein